MATGEGRDRRQAERVSVNCRVEVIERDTLESVGVLMDISSSGMMISSDRDLEVGMLMELTLALCEESGAIGDREINLGAEIVWTQQAPDVSHSWIGLHIIDISDQDNVRIGELISAWQEAMD